MTARCAIALAIPVFALVACAGTPSGQRVETGPREAIDLRDEDDACNATVAQGLVGLRANDVLRQEIAERTRAGTIRWITPGSAVTMDFRADRLNVELDEDNAVVAIRCG